MKASRSMAWMGTQHALRLIVGLLTAVVLARYLGPALYGDYQSVISWVLIFNALAAAGLQSVVIQNLATQNQPGRVLGSALRIRIFFTGFSLLFCITLPLLLGMHSNLWYGVILMSPLLIAQNGDLIEYFYIAQANPRPAVLMRLIGLLTVVFLFVWGLLTQQSWYFFLMAFVAEHIVAAVG
ncbi:MAG: oligosaccharide flippase family protein, partial [Fibrobacter sp.]|nr:oligosaccharide flippase family protein [Fibrobacter sp.]